MRALHDLRWLKPAWARKSKAKRIIELDELTFKGVYEHFYSDCYWDDNISTHYVVLAYRIKLAARFAESPDSQHELLEWLDIDELLSRPDVHENVKAYFI